MSLSYSVGQTNSAVFSQRSGLGPSLGKLTVQHFLVHTVQNEYQRDLTSTGRVDQLC